jgi:hypothetical protein
LIVARRRTYNRPHTPDRPVGRGRIAWPDAAKRKPLYEQLNDFLLDQQFVTVIASSPAMVVSRSNVHNMQWDMHGARKYAEVWLA